MAPLKRILLAEDNAPPPAHHLEFYRKTLDRLVSAEQLPFEVQAEYTHTVSDNALQPLHYAVN